MKKLWEKQQLGKLKLQQLKDWCGAKGLAVGGKKNDLMRRSGPGLRPIEDDDNYLGIRIGSTSDDNSNKMTKD